MLPHDGIEEGQTNVVRKPNLVFPVIIKQLPIDDRYAQCYEDVKWNPTKILELRLKEAVILYGMH